MKGIRVSLKQSFSNYREPTSFESSHTYPLPPYSTVIGMVHNACGYKEYKPMKVSIQGKYNSITKDFATIYEFKNGAPFEAGRHQIKVGNYGVIKNVAYRDLLTDVELLLHIVPENEELLDEIYNSLLYPREYLTLGRREDLVVIDEVKIVNIEFKEERLEKENNNYYYIPLEYNNKTNGTVYNLNKNYILIQLGNEGKGKKTIKEFRHFKKIKAICTSTIDVKKYYIDDDNYLIFLA